jgi:hypothetical protein
MVIFCPAVVEKARLLDKRRELQGRYIFIQKKKKNRIRLFFSKKNCAKEETLGQFEQSG